MKSRHKKHLTGIISKSPMVSFSNKDLYDKNDTFYKMTLFIFDRFYDFDIASILFNFNSVGQKIVKSTMKHELIEFIEEKLPIYNYAYILIPINHSEFKVIDKFDISAYRNLNQRIIINSETLYDVKCDYKKIQNDIIKSFNKYSKLKLK